MLDEQERKVFRILAEIRANSKLSLILNALELAIVAALFGLAVGAVIAGG